MDIAKLSATVRRVAAEQPMYRLETKKDLIAAADVLDQLCGPDPKAATCLTAEASTSSEAFGVATAGPGPTCDICLGRRGQHFDDCTVGVVQSLVGKMNADFSEHERVPMAEAEPIKVILRMEDSPYQS